MRELDIGSKKYTVVKAVDEPPGQGEACHEYQVCNSDEKAMNIPFAVVHFQEGPIKEAGVNGCHHEDLIAICIDRLKAYQNGKYKCRKNALAITTLEEALFWLNQRTEDRVKRGVEGTHAI